MTRRVPAAAFVCAALAFTLPFGTVKSCSGDEVRFTGVELATFSVTPDASNAGSILDDEVEANAGALALVVLLLSLAGLGLALAGWRGGGVCATVALLTLQLVGGAIVLSGSGGGTPQVGYWLSLLSVAIAGLAYLRSALRGRRAAGAKRWTYALPRVVVALLPTIVSAAFLAVAIASSA